MKDSPYHMCVLTHLIRVNTKAALLYPSRVSQLCKLSTIETKNHRNPTHSKGVAANKLKTTESSYSRPLIFSRSLVHLQFFARFYQLDRIQVG